MSGLRNVVVGEVWISLGILGAALRWFSQVETWLVGIRSGQNNLLKNGWSANRYFGGR